MSEYVLEMQNITKEFPGVLALEDVNFKVRRGTIHALVGENGAGKSTLMKVLSGVYTSDEVKGSIIYEGQKREFKNIKDSEKLGIIIIHQELALVPLLSIAENIFLGNEPGSLGVIDWVTSFSRTIKLLNKVGLKESPYTLIGKIGTGKQQLVEIAKALSKDVKLLILDEPTASLNEKDSNALLELLLELKSQGITSILISHKLNEIAKVADVITVIRDGKTIATMDCKTDGVSEDKIISYMVGRDMKHRYPPRTPNIGETIFEVKNWNVFHELIDERKVVNNVNIKVNKGEVVGISGLMGAGRTEFAMSVFGKTFGANITGEIFLHGNKIDCSTVEKAITNKLAYVTEDRKVFGLILQESVQKNTTLANLGAVSSLGVIEEWRENQVANHYKDALKIRCPNVTALTGNLSGGNQQKVVLGKWLFSKPEVLILDEPTRGIDVGAKYEIYCIISDLVAQGKGVIFISSEMPELLGMCDRIYVMNDGRFVDEMKASDATQEKIMKAIVNS